MIDNKNPPESAKPDTRPLDAPDAFTEARLRVLEHWFSVERFKEDVYYPSAIKTEGAMGEFRGRLDSAIENLAIVTRKADNAVAIVNDHDTRASIQFAAFENRIENNTRKVMEMSSQFDQIITYIRREQEAEKDRQLIMQRGQRIVTIAARIIFAVFAGLGGLQALDHFLKVILGG